MPQEEQHWDEVRQDLASLQAAFHADRYLHPRPHLHQRQFHMVMQLPLQSLILENGHRCTRDPRRQEEEVHQMVQEEAQEQEWVTTLIQGIIHAKEEDRQGLMGQEKHSPQEEAIQEAVQEAMPVAAAHLQAPRHRSKQEEQDVQVAHRRIHLQAYLNPEDTLIHGLRWIDLEKLYRSYRCPPTTRIAVFWICSRF